MQGALLTVITPTYNRAHTLPVCYDSLCNQTDQRFMWLIIDDGSTDKTEELVSKWIDEHKVTIMYYKKSNGGKASALNVAIEMLTTKYAVCLDSDDTFYPAAIECALNSLARWDADEECCGILALRNNPDGTVMGGTPIPRAMNRITAADVFLKLQLKTELVCFYKVTLLKNYRFPEFPDEKFVSPAWMQYEITQKYYYGTSWDKICSCEYMRDGLTCNKKNVIVKNPYGYSCVKLYSFNLSPTLKLKVKHGIMYDCGCLIGKDKRWLRNAKHKILALMLMPLAMIVRQVRFRNV